MLMPERFGGGDYRYDFGSQERDDEVSGKGNSYTATYWQYDSRLGRRWNRDPKPNTSISEYATFANNPLIYTDPLGDTTRYYDQSTGNLIDEIIDGDFLHSIKIDKDFYDTYKSGLPDDYDLTNVDQALQFTQAVKVMADFEGYLRGKTLYELVGYWKPIGNVLAGKDWVSFAEGNYICGKAARKQCGKGGANPAWDWGQVELYVDESRQKTESAYKTLKSNVPLALTTIDQNLQKGLPVMAGVEYHGGGTGNLNVMTDHFIVIVGRSNDVHGNYYIYWDNVVDQTNTRLNKLYYNGNGLIDSNTPLGQYTVTEIRPNQ